MARAKPSSIEKAERSVFVMRTEETFKLEVRVGLDVNVILTAQEASQLAIELTEALAGSDWEV
jgi:hypothetical protein